MPDDLDRKFDRIPAWRFRYPPATVKVLVVTDGAYYDEGSGFGLGIALKDAFDPAHPDHPSYVRFQFTRATHAQKYPDDYGADAGWDSILLTAERLEGFDELWLFGVKVGAPYLEASEIAAIDAFMDQGKGVLAMGDHEDLGLGLCGAVKRVRSMRKWWFNSPVPPAGMLRAPDSTDLTRNDTVHAITAGGDPNVGDQDDATPQTIFPRYRTAPAYWSIRRRVKWPHPILCGPRGVIKIMPDHQHEGDCIMPDAAFAGEYPADVQVEIIADGKNVVGRDKAGYTISEPRQFGLLGVWNGHASASDEGRVVVDSTWHHWFNVNLFGLRAENGDEYKDVLAFFRNVGIWLAPKRDQEAMRKAGQLMFLLSTEMIEHTLTLKELREQSFFALGKHARDVIGRFAPQCQAVSWFLPTIERYIPKWMIDLDRPDPKQVRLPEPVVEMEALAAELTVNTMLGSILNHLAVAMHKQNFDRLEALDKSFDELVDRGAKTGAAVARKQLAQAHERLAVAVKDASDSC